MGKLTVVCIRRLMVLLREADIMGWGATLGTLFIGSRFKLIGLPESFT